MPNPYSSPKSRCKLIARDVACVETYARYLMIVDDDGYPLAHYFRDSAPLNIIAVLGPAMVNEQFIATTLLLEVGLGRARPYHSAQKPLHSGDTTRSIPKRRQYHLLDDRRFANLWPFLSDILDRQTREVTSQWKQTAFVIPSHRARVRQEGFRRTVVSKFPYISHERGARVSVSFADHVLLLKMIGFDLARRKTGIHAQSRLIGLCAKQYCRPPYSDSAIRRYAKASSSKMRLLVESLSSYSEAKVGKLRPHHVAYMRQESLISNGAWCLLEQCARIFSFVDWNRVEFFQKFHLQILEAPLEYDVWIVPIRKIERDYLVCELINKVVPIREVENEYTYF